MRKLKKIRIYLESNFRNSNNRQGQTRCKIESNQKRLNALPINIDVKLTN